MRIFGIDPGSVRTGYGCVDTSHSRHRLVTCGALSAPPGSLLPERLHVIHDGLARLLRESAPDCVVVEALFHARNARSALVLGHARGVAVLAAVEAGLPLVEYSPAEVKLAIVGYGRADKTQMQQMVRLLLGLAAPPRPHDAADALAVAICHAHSGSSAPAARARARLPRHLTNWRAYRPAAEAARSSSAPPAATTPARPRDRAVRKRD